ncbi:MAG: DNA polymerase/3'-5' exonuclease PolX, partial [Phycisphaerales bacterium]
DLDNEALAQLDLVIGSVHSHMNQGGSQMTDRLLRALENPWLDILGHPTGRLVARRKGLEPDMAALIAATKAHDVALEINAHFLRLDLRDSHVKAAVDAGCLIAINCDTHDAGDADNLRYGVLTGRRGWLSPDQCINTWPAPKLHAWLKRKR